MMRHESVDVEAFSFKDVVRLMGKARVKGRDQDIFLQRAYTDMTYKQIGEKWRLSPERVRAICRKVSWSFRRQARDEG